MQDASCAANVRVACARPSSGIYRPPRNFRLILYVTLTVRVLSTGDVLAVGRWAHVLPIFLQIQLTSNHSSWLRGIVRCLLQVAFV